jgi:hypothetical protein
MKDHSLAGIVWALSRLQSQCEAVINALERQQPGFHGLVSEELHHIRENGRILEIGLENRREIEGVSDWSWLKSNRLDPDSPAT